MDKSCAWILLWIIRIQPLDIRHQDQKIRIYQRRHIRSHCIVIPKVSVQFLVYGYRVILIYDRHHAHCGQFIKRIPRIFLALFIGNRLFRQKYLCRQLAVLCKEFFIHHHEPSLSYRRAGLADRLLLWPFRKAQYISSNAHGTR